MIFSISDCYLEKKFLPLCETVKSKDDLEEIQVEFSLLIQAYPLGTFKSQVKEKKKWILNDWSHTCGSSPTSIW
jgi:hypothetical protein